MAFPVARVPVRPEDFPRGTAESDGFGYLDLKDELRQKRDPDFKPKPRPKFGHLMFDLDYGKVMDAGVRDYGEFFANLEYGWDLLHQHLGKITVVHRYANGVQLKWSDR